MNEKERHEQVKATLSLVILPLIKETRKKLNLLFLLNLLGTISVFTLVGVLITLILIQGVCDA